MPPNQHTHAYTEHPTMLQTMYRQIHHFYLVCLVTIVTILVQMVITRNAVFPPILHPPPFWMTMTAPTKYEGFVSKIQEAVMDMTPTLVHTNSYANRNIRATTKRPTEIVFMIVASMQRSSSTFLTSQVLAGRKRISSPKFNNVLYNTPPPSTCPLHHVVSLNEIFLPGEQHSGDAWSKEGADYGYSSSPGNWTDGNWTFSPHNLTVPELEEFLLRVAQRRCHEQIQSDRRKIEIEHDKKLTMMNATSKEEDVAGPTPQHPSDSGTTLVSLGCPAELRHHQCLVTYKHFDVHLPPPKSIELWESLSAVAANPLRMVILERPVEERWRSYWVAQETGDWNVFGDPDHKSKLQQMEQQDGGIPPVDSDFQEDHVSWYELVRAWQGDVPRREVTYAEVITDPLALRASLLDMVWGS